MSYVTFMRSIIRPRREIRTSFNKEKSWSKGLDDAVKIAAILSNGMVESKSIVNLLFKYLRPVLFASKTSSPVSMS